MKSLIETMNTNGTSMVNHAPVEETETDGWQLHEAQSKSNGGL